MAPIRLLESRSSMAKYLPTSTLDPEDGHGNMDTPNALNSDVSLTVGRSSVNNLCSLSDEKASSLLISPKAARTLGWGDRQDAQKPVKERKRFGIIIHLAIASLLVYSVFQYISPPKSTSLGEESWKTLQHHVPLLSISPIPRSEFLARQTTLAGVLDKAGVDAFIAEPSASTAYFANISTTFELSERPFLVIITKTGQFSYLAPKFELGRIAGLDMVFENKTVIEWHEEESPFEALKRATGFQKVMLDEHVRFFIATGLEKAGIKVVAPSEEVQSIRAVKSQKEIAILRAINEFTVELVRSLQRNIKIGVTQAEITSAANYLFSTAGIGKGFWALILIGEQAANPHGGSFGRVLKDGEFVLIDIGSSLHGYGSDVTRTFLPAGSTVSDELLGVWWTVYAAQKAAVETMRSNETCSVVDAASRKVISNAGFGPYYTHRLGHGLGLEMHEHPYLNGANSEKLRPGNVVTNEPGIYVTSEEAKNIKLAFNSGFGIRLEDAVLVTEDKAEVLTGRRARGPYEP